MSKELKIFTTYHSISPKDGINISLFQPKFKHYDNTAKLFVPTYQLFKIQDYNVLTNAWNEKLKQTFNEKYLEQYLYDLQGDNDRVVLCCYEKDRNTCHRKIIGDFITLFLGIEVKELDTNTKVENKKNENNVIKSLF